METGMRERFWERYTLEELTPQEWEALCDARLGQCCLLKLHDDETQELAVLNVACRLLDIQSCQCSDYPNRFDSVPDCTQLTPATGKRVYLAARFVRVSPSIRRAEVSWLASATE